jgi:hypothetical protein
VSFIKLYHDIDMEDVVNNTKICAIYHGFLSILLQSASDLLPIYCLFNHVIKLKDHE